ncbi:MAG: T9SS type A sorting domain-containing protein [Bacteroidota bacterium]
MRFLLLLCTCVLAQTLSAHELTRSVVGSAGSYYSAVNVGNIHWTVGEIAVDRTVNGIVLERGFHHGLYELLSTSVWTAPEIELNVTVFPNPTADRVTLTGDWNLEDRLVVRDLLGRQVADQMLQPERSELALGQFPAGTYLLTIVRSGRPLQSMRVIRQ